MSVIGSDDVSTAPQGGFVALDQKITFCSTIFPKKCIPGQLPVSMKNSIFAVGVFFVSRSSKNSSNRSPNGLQTE